MSENLDSAIGKAVEQTTAASQEAPKVESMAPSTEGTSQPTAETAPAATETPPKGTEKAPTKKAAWDGNIEALPEELRDYAKNVQRYVTKHTTEAADLRKKVEEYEHKYPKEKLSAFESWQRAEAAKAAAPDAAPSISQDEWEDALLDTTGQKINAILKRQTQFEVNAARKAVMQEMAAEKARLDQHMMLQQRVKEFADLHPDFKKLNDAGILMPVLRQELEAGGTLESGFAAASAMVDNFKAARDAELKELAEKKKNATTFGKSPASDDHVKWVDSKDEAIEAQIGAAIEGKSIKVRVRPPKAG